MPADLRRARLHCFVTRKSILWYAQIWLLEAWIYDRVCHVVNLDVPRRDNGISIAPVDGAQG